MSESPTPQEVAQVLEDAADLLLVHGRCRFEREDIDGRLCLAGATAVAQGMNVHSADVLFTDAWTTLTAALPSRDYVSLHNMQPIAWNDLPRTTDEDVRDLLLHTAKTCRNEATA